MKPWGGKYFVSPLKPFWLPDHHQRVPCVLHNRCGRQYHRVKVTASDGAGGNGWFQEKPSVALLFRSPTSATRSAISIRWRDCEQRTYKSPANEYIVVTNLHLQLKGRTWCRPLDDLTVPNQIIHAEMTWACQDRRSDIDIE
jgi:hypothetical protein